MAFRTPLGISIDLRRLDVERRIAALNVLHGRARALHPGRECAPEGLWIDGGGRHRRVFFFRSLLGSAMMPARIAAGTITDARCLYVIPPQANSSPG